ncbi:MAG TPA: hypothetical protein VNG31_04980 [Candidatus Baltobacteraceae bacterium]|nr:hypothetical protein [Candidatus Baltobacteraceae bacterium]
MSSAAARLLTNKVSVIAESIALDPARPLDPPFAIDPDVEAIELANASIVSAALGLGIYMDTFV